MTRLRDGRVVTEDVTEILHRAILAEHLRKNDPPEPLYYLPVPRGGRYTPPAGAPALYFAYDAATPMAELRAVLYDENGLPVPGTVHNPIVALAVRAVAGRVLDLTDAGTRRALGVSLDDLRCDWGAGQAAYATGTAPMPVTQLIGLAAYESGAFGGIKYRAVRSRVGLNVMLYPDRLDAAGGHFIEVHDVSKGGCTGRLP